MAIQATQQKGEVSMKFKPLRDRVFVSYSEEADRTAGGIYIPEAAKEKPQKGEVLAVGPGARDETGKRIMLDVQVGDMVLFAKYAGTEIKVDSDKLLILKESDVLAIIEEGKSSSKKK